MKKLYRWLNSRLLINKTLHYKLTVIFCLFFFVPIGVLVYFSIYYNLFTNRYLPVFFMVLLAVSFLGLNLLRKVFDDIAGFSSELYLRLKTDFPSNAKVLHSDDELNMLAASFEVIDEQIQQLKDELHRKKNELSILKGLAEQCYVTANPDEILHLALERALALTGSDIGSILFLNRPRRTYFEVRAAIGLEHFVKIYDRIPFDDSIAKYAVLNKAAMVIEDVEKDPRFGRPNASHYATKSFICLPIKTSREIIGVLTLSSRSHETVYKPEMLNVLEPLLSNAAFSYENLVITAKDILKEKQMAAIIAMLEIINSGFSGEEMLQACLGEIRKLLPVKLLLLMQYDRVRPEEIILLDFLASEPTMLVKQQHFPVREGSTLDRVLRQQTTTALPSAGFLADEHDFDLLPDQKVFAVTAVPLKIQREVSGLLVFLNYAPMELNEEQTFMEWSAGCLSLALERNRLKQAVAKRNRELDSIRQIGSALASSTFDIDQVLNYTMDMIRLIMDVEAGALYLLKDKELAFAVSFHMEATQQKSVRLKLGQGIPGYVAARGEAMVVNENHGDSFFLPEAKADETFPVRSALCVPMISQGSVIGVIEVLNKAGGNFVSDDRDLLQSIAASVSIAIENANLYKETVAMAENERSIRRIFQKFAPKEVLDNILHGSDGGLEMAEELKTLTLLNIDIRRFSGLVKNLGPQKSVALLNAFFSLMGGIVFKHHGIVDKYLGDGFLALFGAPVSSIADADHAVGAALEMQQSLELINQGLAGEMGVQLSVGISVHTGEVVVGNIGFDMKMDYTVIGDPVNDVFRLQDKVRPYPDVIFLSQDTLRATRIPLKYNETDERLGQLKIYELIGVA